MVEDPIQTKLIMNGIVQSIHEKYVSKPFRDCLNLTRKWFKIILEILTGHCRLNCGISWDTVCRLREEGWNLHTHSETMSGTCAEYGHAAGKILNTKRNAATLRSRKHPKTSVGCRFLTTYALAIWLVCSSPFTDSIRWGWEHSILSSFLFSL